MAGYIIVDVKTRKILIPCLIISVLLFIIGIIIGYFAAPSGSTEKSSTCNLQAAIQSSCPVDKFTKEGKKYLER